MSEARSQAQLVPTNAATSRFRIRWNQSSITAALTLLLLVLIAAGTRGLPLPLAAVRLLLTVWFLLFAPGYALQAAVFPHPTAQGEPFPARVDRVDRLALSFGLSLAVDAGIAMLLDRMPWGIRLWPIVIAEALVIGAATAIAWYRRRGLPHIRQVSPAGWLEPKRWWQRQSRRDRILYGILALAALMSLVAAGSILVSVPPGARFSEFYVLGREGQAERYPYSATVGQPITVTLGIVNREGETASYRGEVRDNGVVVASLPPVQLRPGEKREIPVQFAPAVAGEGVPLTFVLYRDGGVTPYRSLRLWLEVKSAP